MAKPAPDRVRVGGPLAPSPDGFFVDLVEQGYRLWPAQAHLEFVASVSRWMQTSRFPLRLARRKREPQPAMSRDCSSPAAIVSSSQPLTDASIRSLATCLQARMRVCGDLHVCSGPPAETRLAGRRVLPDEPTVPAHLTVIVVATRAARRSSRRSDDQRPRTSISAIWDLRSRKSLMSGPT